MNRTVWWFAILVIIVSAGLYWWSGKQSLPSSSISVVQTATNTPHMAPTLPAPLTPLYKGENVVWDTPKSDGVIIGTSTYSGTSVASAAIPAAMNPASVFTPFNDYYDQKLKAAGFSIANDLAAGGAAGGQTGYRKGNTIVLVDFRIIYHNHPANAPGQCPCDVSFSLFSGS